MMEFEQDYMIRQIKNFTAAISNVIFHKDTAAYSPSAQMQTPQADLLYRDLNNLLSSDKINEAENLLFEKIDPRDTHYLEIILDFYSRLNDLDEEYLNERNFSHEEIRQGLFDAAARYGITLTL